MTHDEVQTKQMKQKFSIRIEFPGVHPPPIHPMLAYTTAVPFNGTAEEANQKFVDFSSKIQSIIIAWRGTGAVQGLQLFVRHLGANATSVQICVDEIIIPPAMLTNSFIRYTLLEHKT
jgi:hypothetical protein